MKDRKVKQFLSRGECQREGKPRRYFAFVYENRTMR
jgi:hypothetical protein